MSALNSLFGENTLSAVVSGTIIVLLVAWVLSKPDATKEVATGLADAYSTGVRALRP